MTAESAVAISALLPCRVCIPNKPTEQDVVYSPGMGSAPVGFLQFINSAKRVECCL